MVRRPTSAAAEDATCAQSVKIASAEYRRLMTYFKAATKVLTKAEHELLSEFIQISKRKCQRCGERSIDNPVNNGRLPSPSHQPATLGHMRLLVFSDIHGSKSSLERLMDIDADYYFAAGDLANWGRGLEQLAPVDAKAGRPHVRDPGES